MEDSQFTDEEKESKQIDTWFENSADNATTLLKELEEKVMQMETFDLLSNIAFYNHLHDANNYSDIRGDKMFVISELIALIALKKEYVPISAVDTTNGNLLLKEIQKLGNNYFSLMTMLQMVNNKPGDDYSMTDVTFHTMRRETIIRNPALPEHYRMFTKELYAPLDDDIKHKFGFSVKEGIAIVESVMELISHKVEKARDAVGRKAIELVTEVFRYRSSKDFPKNGLLVIEDLEQLNKLSRKQIKEACLNYATNEMFFRLGETYCFTNKELADFSGCATPIVDSFITCFSCHFPNVEHQDTLVGPTTILKSKPLIEHNGRVLVPSFPLLTWCMEPIIDNFINSVQKLQNRFQNIKHDFLLHKGIELFSFIFKGKIKFSTNLYYYKNDDKQNRYETDCIFIQERTLFILEAKGHRISLPAKQGKIVRMEKHMEQIIKSSYEQSLRTLEYVLSKPEVSLEISKDKTVKVAQNDFDDIVLISLVLEPIGNITPLIRATNELGYFKKDIFPWIISIYDLQVIADHLELPVLLSHYIKRRREFLSNKVMQVFEETDLLSYYLFNRLYIDGILRDAESNENSLVYMGNQTDEINNYYMHKYRLKNTDAPKLKLQVPNIFLKILFSLEESSFDYRQELMLAILDISPDAMEKFTVYIEKVKNLFAKDFSTHNCSILTNIGGKKVGFTFLTCSDKLELDQKLYFFCLHSLETKKADVWIGIGDINCSKSDFTIASCFTARL